MKLPNHPMVRVRHEAGSGVAVRLDVNMTTALLTPSEALRLFADLKDILVLGGYLAPKEGPL